MAKKVTYHGNNMDRIIFKTVKLTKKAVLGLHTGILTGIGAGYRIHEDMSDVAEVMRSKKGKLMLKKVAATGMVITTLVGMGLGIKEVAKHIPEASAAEIPMANNSIVQDAGDLDTRYETYDTNLIEDTNTQEKIVTILHNADGSDYSQDILESTGGKLEKEGIKYQYASNNDELLEDIKLANANGEKANVISIENGQNNYDQTLIASSYVAGQDDVKTPSEQLADSIVSHDFNRLYTDNGVASPIVDGQRTAGTAQEAITQENLINMHNGTPLNSVDTLITVRPSSQDIYNPDELGKNIGEGIADYYYPTRENTQSNGYKR